MLRFSLLSKVIHYIKSSIDSLLWLKVKAKAKAKIKESLSPTDNYARISYLYQISNQFYLAHPEYQALSRGYNRNLDLIAKTVIKLSPHIKGHYARNAILCLFLA